MATAAERSLHARLAVEESWARTSDPTARTAPAREAFRRKFEDKVDPEHKLSPEERARRAEYARRAFYTRLALKSAQSKRRKRGAKAGPRESNMSGAEK